MIPQVVALTPWAFHSFSTKVFLKGVAMSKQEEWRDLPDYEGRYQVSDTGRVRSPERRDTLGKLRKQKILKTRKDRFGYMKVWLHGPNKNGTRGRTVSVHRLVAEAFMGPSDLFVDHLNGLKDDNRPENLEYVTNKENIRRYRAKNKQTGASFKPHCTNRPWQCLVNYNGKVYALGCYETKEECYKVKKDFLNKKYKEESCGIIL